MKRLLHYFNTLKKEQIAQFDQLQFLYEKWNRKINVISRKDIDELYIRHVLHSLAIAKVISFKPGTTILDIGTGGGFPGIPLAILFPECHFTLVDSIGKKIIVVEEVAKALELKNVSAIHCRADEVEGSFDFIISRAVTHFSKFLPWTTGKVNSIGSNQLANGILYLKGGDLEQELEGLKQPKKIWELKSFYEEAFFETKKLVHLQMV